MKLGMMQTLSRKRAETPIFKGVARVCKMGYMFAKGALQCCNLPISRR
jgi:hypothetical protein